MNKRISRFAVSSIVVVIFCVSAGLQARPVSFDELWLASDGYLDFGDEDYETVPITVEFRLTAPRPGSPAIPVGLCPTPDPADSGCRELAQIGPLNLYLALGQVEMRLALSDGGEAFTSRPVQAMDLIQVHITDETATLFVGSGATALVIPGPGPDPGVFELGKDPGPELRMLDFRASSGLVFADGFESGDFSGWSNACPPECEP